MLVGSVALCNGEETGQSCFRGEIVVVVGQEGHRTIVVSNAEHVQVVVIQFREVCPLYQPVHFVYQVVGHFYAVRA